MNFQCRLNRGQPRSSIGTQKRRWRFPLKHPRWLASAIAGSLAAALCLAQTASAAADEEAARALARQNNCFKCHGIDKKKDGPAWRDVAAKYKGKPDAEATLTHHITSGEKAKFADGHEEDHKIVKAGSSDEIKNLVDWILSL